MPAHSILLIEDNPDDVFIMRRALKKAGVDLPLHIVGDGREAVDYLRGAAQFADREKFPLPAVTFLDLKLPYMNGFEVLEWIRDNPELRELNVVILTSSGEERDFQRAHELGVASYLVKPPMPDVLLQTIGPLLERVAA